MLSIVLRRLLGAPLVLLAVTTLAFAMMTAAPGGPFDDDRQPPPGVRAQLEKRYQLDQPWLVQYGSYLSNLLRGDLGPSYRHPGTSVDELIADGLPISLELGLYALLLAMLLGVSAGVLAAAYQNRPPDYLPMSFAMLGICIPSFVIGPLLVLVFSIYLEWLPVSGWGQLAGDKILPSVTLGFAYAAWLARLTRGGMLETMNQDFIRTARAKGMSEMRVVLVHGLRVGLLPVIAFLGPACAGLLSGSFVVETIFQIPGLGRTFIQATFNRDYTMILGTTILFSALIITFNLLSDLVHLMLDPMAREHQT